MFSFKQDKDLDPGLLFDLYKSIDWADDSQGREIHGELIAKVYANSNNVVSAWDGERLVGVARVITDKFAHALVFGLCVYPEFKDTDLPKSIIEKCMDLYPSLQWSTVVEDWEKGYFEELGFGGTHNTYLQKGDCPV